MSDEESEYFIIINKDGDVVLVSTNENGLTRKQFEMVEKLVASADPSYSLLLILYIVVFLMGVLDELK